jgi:hypothetical protein
VVAVLSGLASACANQPVPERPPDRPAVRVQPTSVAPVFAFEDAGTIIVDSNLVCGQPDEYGVEIAGSLALPDYADAATVLLNGWRFRYLSGDHHVSEVGAWIRSVVVDPAAINWVADGRFYDRNPDDVMEFCYVYTVIGWNSGLLDAVAVNDTAVASDFSSSNTTALRTLSFIAETGPLADRRTVVPLPRGFELGYAGSGDSPLHHCFECYQDHNILQLAHNMEHNEPFLEAGKNYSGGTYPNPELDAPDLLAGERRIDANYATWEPYGIIKDNDLRRDTYHVEYVAVLGGDDIAVVRPPFSILPAEDEEDLFSSCVAPDAEVKTEEYVIENLPFDYALPMLTGWNLTYSCDDEHVAEVGVWLEDFSYEKAPDAPTGTLRYTLGSVLRDKEDGPNHTIRHKVDVLGLNGRLPTDLVPQAKDAQFCDVGPGGLLVTVANVGADDAPASMTRIQFAGGVQEDLPTPPLGKGFAVTLDPIPLPPVRNAACDLCWRDRPQRQQRFQLR